MIAGIALGCGAATVIEAVYDTPTSQYYVYQAKWFYALLTLFGLNILCVALSRWPWKRRHLAFLIAHLGILILLLGSFITYRHGLDASMRVAEGDVSNLVEVNTPVLTLADDRQVREVSVPWTPPIAKFSPIWIPEFGLTVAEFMTHAETKVSFQPSPEAARARARPAIRLEIRGAMMRIPQELWLWAGDPAWSMNAIGPATFRLADEASADVHAGAGVSFVPQTNGDLVWSSASTTGASKRGRFKAGAIQGQKLDPGWAMKFEITVREWIPHASRRVDYIPAKQQFGMEAPPSAIRVTAGETGEASIWLGMGDRAQLEADGKKVTLVYLPKRHILPFGIRLDRFDLTHYEGTRNPASYSSTVGVVDGANSRQNVVISMNEPLTHQGITFYQSSYEDALPRPTVSIFSVNRDPGRRIKYLGSLLIVLGSMLLFYERLRKKSAPAPAGGVGGVLT